MEEDKDVLNFIGLFDRIKPNMTDEEVEDLKSFIDQMDLGEDDEIELKTPTKKDASKEK